MLTQPVSPPDDARAILDLRLIATLGTTNDDGSPLLTPIWFLFDPDDRRLYIPTGSGSRKVRNVLARPRATLLVDQRSPDLPRWASATGPTELVRGAAARAVNARAQARYLTAAGQASYGVALEAADDVAIALTPERWKTWRPTFLEQLGAERGLSADELRAWFHPLD